MKVLIAGGTGQVGIELQRLCPANVKLTAPGSSELDITDREQTGKAVDRLRPDVIINAAAYTAVDRAESEPERAFALNSEGAANLASAAAATEARLIHISTDFVFDGKKSRPYVPSDPPAPLNVYGKSKLQGEIEVARILGQRSVIIRTSWVYSAHRHNFVRTMLSLMSERKELKVVADQAGTPTWARSLAEVVWKTALRPEINGTFHWSDSGIASWYDFACSISRIATNLGILSSPSTILPINTHEYPTPARRPYYSVLDKSNTSDALGIIPMHWEDNLLYMLMESDRETQS